MKLPKEIYLVVTEHDGSKDGQPIVWETYLNEHSTKEGALRQAERLNNRFGETRIGRLIIEEENEEEFPFIDLSDVITDEEIQQYP